MKKAVYLFMYIVIPGLWILSMTLLAGHTDEAGRGLRIDEVFGETPGIPEGQNWTGIYLKGEKIGYSYTSYQNSNKGVLFKEYLLMRIPLGGTVREVIADNFALLDSSFSVRSFSAGMSSGEYDITIHGLVNGNNLEIKYITGGTQNTRNIPLDEPLYFQGLVPRLIKLSGFKPGMFSIPVFDPLSMNISKLNIKVGDLKIVDGDTLYVIGLELSGIKTVMTIDKEANIIKDEQPGGMMLVREPREKATALKNIYGAGEDFLIKLSVPSSSVIENDRQIRYLRAELHGLDPENYVLDDRSTQKLTGTEPVIIEIDRKNPRRINDVKYKEFLKPTDFIQSDDPAIKELSEKIIKGLQSDEERAFAIGDWVYKNITKDITISVPSAVEVLRVKRGDCNEHTALYTALARAAGVPCKTVVGIVHKDGVFFYHAWPAVFLGYWHQLDPTFGQHEADATHIQLLEGGIEKQAELVNVVGKLKVEILEYD